MKTSKFRPSLSALLVMTFATSLFPMMSPNLSSITTYSESGETDLSVSNTGSRVGEIHRDSLGLFSGLANAAEVIWEEHSWLLLPFFFVLVIKRILLRQSYHEITACVLEIVSFLLRHAIELARYAAIHLQKIAKELRRFENQTQ